MTKPTQQDFDDALAKTLQAEEYEEEGRKLRRSSLGTLKSVTDDVAAAERVATKGNILERTRFAAVRRG